MNLFNYFIQIGRFLSRLWQITYIIFDLVFLSKESRAVRFRLFFEQMGGAFLKFGQILSLRYDLLPEGYTQELLGLLSRVPTVSFEVMRPVFLAETGHYPETLFKDFDEKPIASASISQVYLAVLPSGERVAVKLQRPNTIEIFETDIILASFLARVLGLFQFFRSWEVGKLINDFSEWTKRELDFRFEAQNANALYQYSSAHERTVIPKIYNEWTTKRLMVSEYLEEIWPAEKIIREVDRDPGFRTQLLLEQNIDLKEMANYFVVDMMRQYLIDGFFHADPHPANIFFLPNNRLGYFDFGIVGESSEERVFLLRIIYGILKRDLSFSSQNFLGFSKSAFRKEAELFKDKDLAAYERYGQVIDKVEEIMVDNLRLDLEELLAPWYEKPGSSLSSVFTKMMLRTRKYGINLPNAAAIFFRTLVIIGTVALRLDPTFDILESFRRFFDQYPLYTAEEIIRERMKKPELASAIDPLSHLSFEAFLELKEEENERLIVARERLGDLIMSYAEKYEEIRKLLP